MTLIQQNQPQTVTIDGHSCMKRQLSSDPQLIALAGVLSKDEINHLLNISHDRFEASVAAGTEEDRRNGHVRDSSTAIIASHKDSVVSRITHRLATLLGVPEAHLESYQLVKYVPGQRFTLHHDSFGPNDGSRESWLSQGGQRVWTALMYLNSTSANSGATRFPYLGLEISPRAGAGVLFKNVDQQGNLDLRVMHEGLPISEGEKYVLVTWARECETNTTNFSDLHLPGDIQFKLEARGAVLLPGLVSQEYAEEILSNLNAELPGMGKTSEDSFMSGSQELYKPARGEKLLLELLPTVEGLLKTSLLPAYSFFRSYSQGDSLPKHVDRSPCEISISICLTQNAPWGLKVETKQGTVEEYSMSRGDATLLQGMVVPHWRERLEYSIHQQLFLHYVLANGELAGHEHDTK